MDDKELWRPVPSRPGILASSHGRVMIAPYFKGLRIYGGEPTTGQWDGTRFIYCRRGHPPARVARLICEAFNGAAPTEESVCMHLDENARNNRPTNLAWGTQKENLNAPGFLAHCRSRTGDNSPTTKARRARSL